MGDGMGATVELGIDRRSEDHLLCTKFRIIERWFCVFFLFYGW